jgi:hypothetical protein
VVLQQNRAWQDMVPGKGSAGTEPGDLEAHPVLSSMQLLEAVDLHVLVTHPQTPKSQQGPGLGHSVSVLLPPWHPLGLSACLWPI